MELVKQDRDLFLKIAKQKKVYLEGNIVKILKGSDGDTEFNDYLNFCIKRDNDVRKKRLDITKQVQSQNKELESVNDKNIKLMEELKNSLEESNFLREEAETAKNVALSDLEVIQKKTQFELINLIVKVALWMIIGVGITTSLLYGFVLWNKLDSTLIESTWSNMFSILLTNSFSIIGTIMGVKYVTNKNN